VDACHCAFVVPLGFLEEEEEEAEAIAHIDVAKCTPLVSLQVH